MARVLLSTFLIFAGLSVILAQEIGVGDILVYAPFDGSPDARIAVGEKKAVTKGELQFEKGRVGKALVVGDRKMYVGFELKNNIDLDRGSIAFWVAPLGWDHTTEASHSFIHAKSDEELQLYYFFAGKAIFVKLGFQDSKLIFRDTSPAEWEEGEWRHIVLNWEESRVALYDNAYIRAEFIRDVSLPRAIGTVLYMGKFPELSKDTFTYKNDTLIDEFYIFNRPLTVPEIRELMKRGRPKEERDETKEKE
jgi:hypothetical protein